MSDIDNMPWIHVYGQYMYHSEAVIRGTAPALTALRDAIDSALKGGEAEANVFATDGEGYEIKVQKVNTCALVGEPEYLYRLEYKLSERAAERLTAIRGD